MYFYKGINMDKRTDRKEKARTDRRNNRRDLVTHAEKAGTDRRGVSGNDVTNCSRKGGITKCLQKIVSWCRRGLGLLKPGNTQKTKYQIFQTLKKW